MKNFKSILIIVVLVLFSLPVLTQTVYTVTKTTDPDPFGRTYHFDDSLCHPDLLGTLSWAIRKTNDTQDSCIIEFDIPGAGPHIITLNNYLPTIKNSVSIDGTTQHDYQIDNPSIIISGHNKVRDLLTFYGAANCTVNGIKFIEFVDRAIFMQKNNGSTIINNQILCSQNTHITTTGILIYDSYGVNIHNNKITSAAGCENDVISGIGINLRGATSCFIGNAELQNGNLISCFKRGILFDKSIRITISGNLIFNNELGIEFFEANNNKLPPEILNYEEGVLSGTSSPNDIIEIFGSTGEQNANEYIASTITDMEGNWSIEVATTYEYFIATATVEGNTSELSGVFFIPPVSYYNNVITTNLDELTFEKYNEYDIIHLQKREITEIVGEPQLPVKKYRFVLPPDANIKGVVINNTTKIQLPEDYYIVPCQPDFPVDGAEPPEFVEPNPEIYNSDNPYPGKQAEFTYQETMHGYNIVSVTFYPVEYIPNQQKINVYTSIDFSIQYEHNGVIAQLPLRMNRSRYDRVKNFVNAMVYNPEDIDKYSGIAQSIIETRPKSEKLDLRFMPSPEGDQPDYIIITNNELKPEFEKLAHWKTMKGVPTLIVTTEDIDHYYNGCDLAEKIRNYLIDATENWGTGLFILLGGDTPIVPARFGYYSSYSGGYRRVTDLYYSTIGGNWNANGDNVFGDLSDHITNDGSVTPVNFEGRAPARNIEDAEIFVKKILDYEKNNWINSHQEFNNEYVNNILYVNSISDSPHLEKDAADGLVSNFTHLKSYFPNINGHFLFDTYSPIVEDPDYTEETISKASFISSLNGESMVFPNNYFHLVYHMDHSNVHSLGASTSLGESLLRDDLDLINNNRHLPILFSSGCQPNEFQYTTSFSEAYLNHNTGGGVAFIGNTEAGWTSEWINFPNFCQYIYYDNIINLGNAFQLTRIYHTSSFQGYRQRKRLNLLGCPEMPVWTNTPGTINLVATPSPVTNINNQVEVELIIEHPDISSADVTVSIFKNGEIYNHLTETCQTNTTETFIFTVYPETEGELTITATAHNFIPAEIELPVEIEGPYLCISDYTIDDSPEGQSYGNNDGQSDAGETIELTIYLTNSGTEQVTSIATVLTSESEHVTIIEGNSNYNNISAEATGINLSYFVIEVSAETPDEYDAGFILEITGNEEYTKNADFSIKIAAPEIKQGNKIYPIPIEPDQIVELDIELLNTGNAEVTGLSASISSNSPCVEEISINNSTYNNLTSFTSEYNAGDSFEFKVSSDYTGNPADLFFDLTVQNEYGKTWDFSFNLETPTIIYCEAITFLPYENMIQISWEPVVGVYGYNIHRSDADEYGNDLGNYIKLNYLPITTASFYEDMSVELNSSYYYKIYTVSDNGNEGEACTIFSWTNLPFHAGWPQTGYGRRQYCPNVIDINGDNKNEIFVTSGGGGYGHIHAFYEDGSLMFDNQEDPTFKSYDKRIYGLTLGDINNDGIINVVAVERASNSRSNIHVYSTVDTNGDGLPDHHWSLFNLSIRESVKSPILADLNNDGYLEIILVERHSSIFVYDYQGNFKWSRNISKSFFGVPCVYDISGDGYKEIIFTKNAEEEWEEIIEEETIVHPAIPGKVYILDYQGNENLIYEDYDMNFRTSPVIGDINNNGKLEFITATACFEDINKGKVIVFELDYIDNQYQIEKKWENEVQVIGQYVLPSIAVGDITNDGNLEVVFSGNEVLYIWNHNGENINENFPSATPNCISSTWLSSPLLADVSGNDVIDIILKSSGRIFAYDINGEIVPWFPLDGQMGGDGNSVIADLNNNGKLEYIYSNNASEIYVWETNGSANNIEWGSYRHNHWKTGVYGDLALDILRDGDRCSGKIIGNITATAVVSGGKKPYDYLWSTGETEKSISILYGVDYTLTVTDANGNTTNRSFIIENFDILFPDEYTVEGHGFYNQTGYIHGNLFVPNDSKLTFENTIITAGENANIFVEPGGELIIVNTTITSCEGDMWDGITLQPSPIFLGVNEPLVYTSNSLIENARTAIFSNMLGAVQLTNTTFRNNEIGVHLFFEFLHTIEGFNYYYNRLNSYINNCIFETTAELNDELLYPLYHVRLETRSMTFKGNTFRNTREDNFPLNQRGIGINTFNSNLKILPICQIPIYSEQRCPDAFATPNTFEGLYYGLRADAGFMLSAPTIKQASFENNYRGAYLRGFRWGIKIIHNDFNVGNLGTPFLPDFNINYGLYLDGCTNFKLMENDFHSGDVGLFVNNSGYNYNNIYKNTFSDLENILGGGAGTIILGNNSDYIQGSSTYTGGRGLEIICNNFSNNSFHIGVIDGHIKRIQGSISGEEIKPARNTMTHLCPYSTSDFSIDNSPLSGYLYLYNFDDNESKLHCYSDDIFIYGLNPVIDFDPEILECPSKLYTGPIIDIDEMFAEYITKSDNFSNKYNNYINLIDGGYTEELLYKISTLRPNNYKDLCDDLLVAAPYLSDTVLIEFMNIEHRGRPKDKRDILLACSPLPRIPGEKLTDTWLPPPFKAQVEAQQGGISEREQLETELATLQNKKLEILNDLIFYINEAENYEFKEALIAQLKTEAGFDTKPVLISFLISDNNLEDAQIALNDLQSEIINLPLDLQLEINDYFSLQEIIIDFLQSPEEFNAIITNNYDLLENIANTEIHPSAVIAQQILEYYGEERFDEKVVLPVPISGTKSLFVLFEPDAADEEKDIAVYPNPTSGIVNIVYNIPDEVTIKYVKLYNLQGKLVLTKKMPAESEVLQLDISELPPAIYLISIFVDGEIRFTEKLNVRSK